jgi:hypothetical protein
MAVLDSYHKELVSTESDRQQFERNKDTAAQLQKLILNGSLTDLTRFFGTADPDQLEYLAKLVNASLKDMGTHLHIEYDPNTQYFLVLDEKKNKGVTIDLSEGDGRGKADVVTRTGKDRYHLVEGEKPSEVERNLANSAKDDIAKWERDQPKFGPAVRKF